MSHIPERPANIIDQRGGLRARTPQLGSQGAGVYIVPHPRDRVRFPTWEQYVKPILGVPGRDVAGLLLKARMLHSLTYTLFFSDGHCRYFTV